MKREIILVACAFLLNHFTWAQSQKMNKSIVQSIQQNMPNLPIASYSFCLPEFLFVLQQDTILLTKLCDNESKRLAYLKSNDKDVFLSELLQIKFLKYSLNIYHSKYNDKNSSVKELLDLIEIMPGYELQKNDYHLFFESFTSESGVVAEKIETLLITQKLQPIFEYINSNEMAKTRFLRWIDEDIEVWCPSLDTGNSEWNDRIVHFLYNRLCKHDDILAQQAAKKMKSWFGL